MTIKIFAVLLFMTLPCYGQWKRSEVVDPMTDAQSVVYELAGSDTQGLLTFECKKGKLSSVMLSIPNGVEQFQKAGVLWNLYIPFATEYKVRIGTDKPTTLNGLLSPDLSAVNVLLRKE